MDKSKLMKWICIVCLLFGQIGILTEGASSTEGTSTRTTKKDDAKTLTLVVLPTEQYEVGDIHMKIVSENDVNSSPVSTVVLGQEIYLFIQYIGEANYMITPRTCTAFEGYSTENNKTSVVLLNDSCVLSVPSDKIVMENFVRISNQTVSAIIYAFRFRNSNDVTLSCEVAILPPSHSPQICKKNKRRKGIAETNQVRKQVSNTLKVIDVDPNKSPRTLPTFLFLCGAAVLYKILL